MSERAYVCNRFPFLGIGKAKFQDGLLKTSDPDIQRLVETNEWFNVFIHYRDIPTEPIAEKPTAPTEPPRKPSGVRFGRVGTKPTKEGSHAPEDAGNQGDIEAHGQAPEEA